jgi:hypothetical protein
MRLDLEVQVSAAGMRGLKRLGEFKTSASNPEKTFMHPFGRANVFAVGCAFELKGWILTNVPFIFSFGSGCTLVVRTRKNLRFCDCA